MGSLNQHRPDPDALLARLKAEEARQARGRLKVFLGAAPGVGKTYAMLEAAHERRRGGVDVVVGWVDTHGRPETEVLLKGLDALPRRRLEYRGTVQQEFDLDGALARRPSLILVDELAHSNAPGSRHPKRWLDVLELLDAGISVFTTVNVQHLESLNDVVAKITGVAVRETVPDSVLEQADEIELVDLPPDELLQRLKEGKVYVPELAHDAVRNFFRKGNLIALRELALRRTADRVDAQMRQYMRDHAIRATWPVTERLMACVSAGPYARNVVRAAKRLADSLRAEWIVAYVETPAHAKLSDDSRAQLAETLRFAEQLGAETVVLSGSRISEEILDHARARNVSKVVIGKSAGVPWWQRPWARSIADELMRASDEIHVYIISGEEPTHLPYVAPARPRGIDWSAYGLAALVVASCTVLAWALFPYIHLANLIMLYLLGVVVVAARLGHGPSILASVLSVAAFDFFFVPPYFTFSVADHQYFITFGVMLAVALVISALTVRIRWLADSARQRERQTAALYAMSRELADARGAHQVLQVALHHIWEMFRFPTTVLLPDPDGSLRPAPGVSGGISLDGNELGVAKWTYEHRQVAGRGTATLPGAKAVYLPLTASRGAVGVLAVRPPDPRGLENPERLRLMETFADQLAQALERAQLAEEAQRAQVQAESERLRSSLLSSVSHDLRTPLAAITGAASSLLEGNDALAATTRQDLLETIREEAERLNRLVHNLLDMTRLESGALQLKKEWHPLEEVVGAALGRLEKQLRDRPLITRFPADLPLVPIDGVLLEQLLINLLDNAAKYTPPKSSIEIGAWASNGSVTVEVADRGPGLAPGDEQRVFDKFYRGGGAGSRGVGLGLAICRGIAEAHGGRIWAERRDAGGVAFRFTIPLTGSPPRVEGAHV
jgi:two-component system sensor histidine kinase KdpD